MNVLTENNVICATVKDYEKSNINLHKSDAATLII